MLPRGGILIMKKLTHKEFEERVRAINKARGIFIKSGLTKNISIAFELYQEILSDEQRDITVSGKPPTLLDGIRPECERCGESMGLGPINTVPGNQVEGIWKSHWYCESCDESIFNKETVQEIFRSVRET